MRLSPAENTSYFFCRMTSQKNERSKHLHVFFSAPQWYQILWCFLFSQVFSHSKSIQKHLLTAYSKINFFFYIFDCTLLKYSMEFATFLNVLFLKISQFIWEDGGCDWHSVNNSVLQESTYSKRCVWHLYLLLLLNSKKTHLELQPDCLLFGPFPQG